MSHPIREEYSSEGDQWMANWKCVERRNCRLNVKIPFLMKLTHWGREGSF